MSSVRRTSTLAIVSLIFGILGWFVLPFVGSIVAIITGHMARAEIRRDPLRIEGDGLALAGLILGWLSIALWVVGMLLFLLLFGGWMPWLTQLSS
jgi:Domain of unknown function (DUF4190)